MASNIPVRRTTRTTKNNAITKDNENANARPSRITTRTKAQVEETKPSTRATAATNTKLQKGKATEVAAVPAKRKRGAFAEVVSLADQNKPKTRAAAAKEKDKKPQTKQVFDGVVIPPMNLPATRAVTHTSRTVKQDTGPAASTAVIVVEDVMEIDTVASVRKVSIRRKTRLSIVNDEAELERANKRRQDAEKRALQDESQLEADAIAAQLQEQDQWEEAPPALELEADPEGALWTDMDAEDFDDPAMASEYVVDTFNYLRDLEMTCLPNPTYMTTQKEIDWHSRAVLVDWLILIHARCHFLPETLFLCTNVMDRFLSTRSVSLSKFQLVGITCFLVASKFEETFAPSIDELCILSDNLYTKEEILKAERFVLKTIDWNLSYPNAIHYLRRCSKADDSEVKARTVGKYLLEIGCMEWRLVATPPSLLAAAAMWLARLVLGREDWTPNLAHYSGYRESEIVPIANLMINFILKPVQYQGFHKKYASKKFFKSSVYMRQWALNRWEESSRVDLAAVLPTLKHDIRLDKEAEVAFV